MRVFVTGATGWIGSPVVAELLGAGHEVVGLARSDSAAAALASAGAAAHRGSLDDPASLESGAAASDGVVHLAFDHGLAFSGDYPAAAAADRRAIAAFGAALAGTDRPLVIASGLAGHAPGVSVTEEDAGDAPDPGSPAGERARSEQAVLALASSGVRTASVRLPPTVHGDGDRGFVAAFVAIARERGVSGYIGDGGNHWPAVHRLDAARLVLAALTSAPAGSVLHAVAEEGVPVRAIAEVVGRHLDLPVVSIPPQDAGEHFGWLADFLALDVRASSELTRARLGWQPTGPGLVDDLERGSYFRAAAASR